MLTAGLTQTQSDNLKEKDSVSFYQTEDGSVCWGNVSGRQPDLTPLKVRFLSCLVLLYLLKAFQ